MENNSKIIVVKLGGSIIDARDTSVSDMVSLQRQDYKMVIVHGGAKMVTAWCSAMGLQSRFYEGERVTDRKSLEVVAAVLAGLANKETVAAIIRAGGRAFGISGVDGGLVKGRVRDETLGYIGEVTGVDPSPIKAVLDAGYIPVVSPVSYYDNQDSAEPLLLNINGDTVAGAMAAALGASMLIYLTDVDGIHDAEGNVLSRLTPGEAQGMMNSGVAGGGMIPKIRSCLVAARAGTACRIVDGRRPHALIEAVSGSGVGTTITQAKPVLPAVNKYS
jgi:acetylglutamate kinase